MSDIENKLGSWLSAALEDPNVCEEFKADIRAWMDWRQLAFKGISPWDIAELRKTNEELRAALDELVRWQEGKRNAESWKEYYSRARGVWSEARRLRGKT